METLLFRILLARVWHLNTRIWPKNSFSWNQNSTLFCKNLGESFDRGDIYSGGWGQKSHDPWYLSHLANTHSIGVIAHPKLAWTPCRNLSTIFIECFNLVYFNVRMLASINFGFGQRCANITDDLRFLSFRHFLIFVL